MAPAIALLWLTQGQTADQTVKIPLQTALQIVGILCVFPWVAQLATTPTPRWIHLAAAVRRAARQADQLSASGGSAAARVVRVRGDRIFCARFLANSTFLARPPAQGDQAGAGPGPSALAPTDGPHPSSPNTGSDQPGAGSTVAPNSVAAPMTSTTEQVATRLATRLQHGIRKPRIYIDGTVK
jgi:hypothetical protein